MNHYRPFQLVDCNSSLWWPIFMITCNSYQLPKWHNNETLTQEQNERQGIDDFDFSSFLVSDSLIWRQAKQQQHEKWLQSRCTRWSSLTAQRENDSEWLSQARRISTRCCAPDMRCLKTFSDRMWKPSSQYRTQRKYNTIQINSTQE